MIKYLFKGVCAFMTIMTGATTLMPATDVETAALGPDPHQSALIQMRMARAMMNVAPEFTVARYSEATGMPPAVIEEMLLAVADGTLHQQAGLAPSQDQAPDQVAPGQAAPTQGGAKFIRLN